MESGDAALLLSIVILICLSAFFSSSETALTAVSKVRIKTLVSEGNKRAAIVEKLLDEQQRLISALLIGNNIVNTTLTAIATVAATNLFGSTYLGISTGVLTVIILLFCEITPKNCAAASAEKISLNNARLVYLWVRIITPISMVLDVIVKQLLKLLRVDPDYKGTFTENEIRTIVDESHEEGAIETEEREMINNVFDLSEYTAKDVMIPRVDIVFLDVDASYREIIEQYQEHHYTRMPVCEGDTNNVVGMLNIKDLVLLENREDVKVRDVMRDVYFTYENNNSSELMQEMLKNGITMAVVLDEYGDAAGLLTIEDLLEEIVGEIRDEYDENEDLEKVYSIGEGRYMVDGSAKLEDLKDMIPDFDMESEDYDSIGGIVTGLLGRLPEDGDEVETETGYKLKVCGLNNTHIDKIELTMPEKEEVPGPDDAEGAQGHKGHAASE